MPVRKLRPVTVKQLKSQLNELPKGFDDYEVVLDDLKDGRIPLEDFRIDHRAMFERPGTHSKTAVVIVSDGGMTA